MLRQQCYYRVRNARQTCQMLTNSNYRGLVALSWLAELSNMIKTNLFNLSHNRHRKIEQEGPRTQIDKTNSATFSKPHLQR